MIELATPEDIQAADAAATGPGVLVMLVAAPPGARDWQVVEGLALGVLPAGPHKAAYARASMPLVVGLGRRSKATRARIEAFVDALRAAPRGLRFVPVAAIAELATGSLERVRELLG